MAITPTNTNDAFVREVDDAVREDQILGFWTRYGKLVLGLIGGGLLAYGGYLFYHHNKAQNAGTTAESFVQALNESEAGNSAAATKALATVKAEGDGAYQAAALMTEANNAIRNKDDKKAIALLGQLATDTKAPQIYRDLALLRSTTMQLDTIKPEEVIARVKPLAVESNALFPSAAELVALAYMNQGKDADAGALFGKIAAFEGTPAELKARAQQMAGMLGVDTVRQPAAESGNAKAANDNGATPAAAPAKAAGGEAK